METLTTGGSIAKLGKRSGRVEIHANHPDPSVQRTPFPGRGDSAVRPLVPTLSPRLRARRRTGGGTGRGGRRQLHLALGAGVCAGAERCCSYLRPVNKNYRIDETYIKVRG